MSRDNLAADAIKTFSLNLDKHELSKNKNDYYKEIIENKIEPIQNSIEFLKKLDKDQFKIGLASSTSKKIIEKQLKAIGIYDSFDVIVSGEDDVHNNKPYPDIYLFVADRLNIKAEDCIVIEDSLIGIKSAKNACMKCIALRTKYNEEKDLSEADEIVDNLLNINFNIESKQ